MKKKFIIFLSYIIIFFNSNLFSNENKQILKVGLLAPLSGEYKELGNHAFSKLMMFFLLGSIIRKIEDAIEH